MNCSFEAWWFTEDCFCVECIPGDAIPAQAEGKHGFGLFGVLVSDETGP
jgi:hypothetical protein